MRLLLAEMPSRALPFVHELLASFGDLVTTEADGQRVDLLIIARDTWRDEDTELCRRLHAARSELPLLGLSGPCEARHRAAALRAGADDFLGVPFDIEELVARAFALVRRASSGSRYARVGPFSVDRVRRDVAVDGRHVPLTLREYDLLATLIERAGEVVTRRELAGDMSDSNVVDVHMSRIRDKLGSGYAAQIETVRGLGYRLKQ